MADRLDETDAVRAISNLKRRWMKRRYESQYRLNLGDGRTRVIRAIGQVYVSPDLSSKFVGVNWDVTSDVALTDDLTRSKALTEARNVELKRPGPASNTIPFTTS